MLALEITHPLQKLAGPRGNKEKAKNKKKRRTKPLESGRAKEMNKLGTELGEMDVDQSVSKRAHGEEMVGGYNSVAKSAKPC